MAEAIFRRLVKDKHVEAQWRIDSAGTADYHTGSKPDRRALKNLLQHGINDYHHAARQIRITDFSEFDYIIVMDHANLEDVQDICPPRAKAIIKLLASYDEDAGTDEIGDPYYGNGDSGFEKVYQQCLTCCSKFLFHCPAE